MRFVGIKKWVITLLMVALLGFTVLAVKIYRFSEKVEDRKSDVAVVLGAAVWDDEPSPVFLERINHAVELQKDGIVDKIIFTGGIGKGDEFSEAEMGKLTAVSQGIPDADIFVETTSTVTYENLGGACVIMQDKEWETAVLVSDPLHMKRATVMAADLGLDVVPSPTPTTQYRTWRTKLPSLLYESWYYAWYLVQRPFLDQANCGLRNLD